MSDVLSPDQRRRCMANIKNKDTKPEIIVRRLLWSLGFRYRLHRKDLPGKPDIVLPGHKKIIMVHGCFWHMHSCKYGSVFPRTNADFWQAKRMANKIRDSENRAALERLGWEVLIIWECQTKNMAELSRKITRFLTPAPKPDCEI